MTEAPATVSARIIGIDPGGMMSTIWTFTYLTTEEGATPKVFHADHRPARHLCEGLYEFALMAADDEDIEIPTRVKENRGLMVTFVNVELEADGTMGMLMPSVEPVSLDVERLKQLIEKVKG